MQIDVDGKVRNRPHMVGSWACHVLVRLSIPSTVKQHLYNHFTSHFPQAHTEPDPHISLSKTFYARHWQLNTLKDKLRQATAKVSLPENISLLAHHWTIYYNEERTRAFLALDCDETSSRILGSLVSQIDLVLRGFGFSSYYEEPRFHASLAWYPPSTVPVSPDSLNLYNLPITPIIQATPQIVFKAAHLEFPLT